jgi:NADH-quinone oxidoreductase subunit G
VSKLTLPTGKSKPLVIVGGGVLTRRDGVALLSQMTKAAIAMGAVKDGWNGFGVLHTAASRVAGLDLGLAAPKGLDMIAGAEVVYLLGADEIDMTALGNAFVIYQGSHGDAGAMRADVILPGSAYTEKSVTYVNLEGRAQLTTKAAFAPGEAKDDWAILRALSAKVGHTLPFDSLAALRAQMYQAAPALARLDTVQPADAAGLTALSRAGGTIANVPLKPVIADHYLTNPILRASQIMAELSILASGPARQQAAE